MVKRASPSPQTYNLASEFSSRPKSRAVSFGISREYYRKVYIEENPPFDLSLPGPGHYHPDDRIATSSP